jgi:AcrR family transcriptional regulator
MTSSRRATDRAPIVQQSRRRTAEQQQVMLDAARRLVAVKGSSFTTQDLVKESGVALQTFYRHFGGKDQLILALIEELIEQGAYDLDLSARDLPDPVARLRFYITNIVLLVGADDPSHMSQFVTAEHWRLHQVFPQEVAAATRPFSALIERELLAATDAGLLHPSNPSDAAWFTTELLMSVYHHYAFVAIDRPIEAIVEQMWQFCLVGFGGQGAVDEG